MSHLTTKICEQNVSIIKHTIKDKSLKLLSFMERETRLVSCSLAFNGNSVFCLQGFQPLQQKHSSLSSLTQLAKSNSSLYLQANKKEPLTWLFFISGRRGSNSRHPPWQTVNMNKHEAFSLFSALLNKILIPRKIIHRLHIGYMDFEPRLLLIYLRIIL